MVKYKLTHIHSNDLNEHMPPTQFHQIENIHFHINVAKFIIYFSRSLPNEGHKT